MSTREDYRILQCGNIFKIQYRIFFMFFKKPKWFDVGYMSYKPFRSKEAAEAKIAEIIEGEKMDDKNNWNIVG